MLNIFILWIMFQLIIIGLSGANKWNKIIDGTYDCESREKINIWWGALFPLAFFATEEQYVKDYCNNKKENENKNI